MAAMVAIAVFRKEPELRTISRRLDLQLHQVEQIGAAGDDFRAWLEGRGGGARGRVGALVGEGLHVGNPAVCLMAATMLG